MHNKDASRMEQRGGRILPYFLGWLIGIPIPILIIVYLLNGCQ